ncbi:MAG: cadherin-like domain-containing protein, partial [Candidatus Competibacteraceae bacterium]|nr:cadherin-like domain-containing protein [Candidatus Competibacteraceae bacterium]
SNIFPANNATGVAINSDLTITFSEDVTVSGNWAQVVCPSGTQSIDGSGGAVGTLGITDADPTYTLNPSVDFANGESCTVTVFAAQVEDDDLIDPPQNMAADFMASFTTVDVAPEITSTTPAEAATVGTGQDVTLNFSENVDVTTASITFNCGAAVAFTPGPASDINTLTLTPNSALPEGATCTVTVPAAAVTDSDTVDPPDELAAAFTLNFSTDAAPDFVSSTPANNATDIALTSTVQITFSENVDATAGDLGLSCDSNSQAFTVSGSGSAVLTLTPSANLPSDANCIVTLTNGINDSDAIDPPDEYSGNVLSFSFTTVAVGTIVIIKDTVPDAAQDFSFTTTGGLSPASFALDDDADGTLPNTQTFNIAPGNYSVTETATAGYLLTGMVCNDPTSNTMTAGNTANINLASGETVTCTFTNEPAIPPTANDDFPNMASSPGDAFHTVLNITLDSSALANTPAVTANDTLGSPAATVTAFDNTSSQGGTVNVNANGEFTYTPPSATFTGPDTFTYTLMNAAGSSTATVTIAVGERPTIANDGPRDVTGNVRINTTNSSGFSVLGNDGGDQISITAFDATSANGGNVSVNTTTGTFSYNPPPGFEGSDSFTYTVGNGFGSSPAATVLLTVSDMLWFIDNNAGTNGDGRLGSPFNSIANFNSGAADGTGDNIFLYRQTATNYAGPLTLLNNQKLIGQGATASLSAITGLTPPIDSDALPGTSGTRPVIAHSTNNLTLAQGNTLRGLNLSNTGGTAFIGTNFGNLVTSEMSVSNSNGIAINLNTGNPTATFTSVSASGGANGIVLTSTTGSFIITGDGSTAGSGGTIQNTTANAVSLTNASNVALNFVNISNSNANGIFGNNVTGFTLNGANVTNNGNAVNEGGLRFDQNLLGTAVISNSTISGSAEHNIEIINTMGVLNLSITDSTISTNSAALGADGLLLETRNSAQATVVVTGSTFNDNQSDGIQISAIDASVATLTVNDTDFTSSLDASPAGSVGARGIVLSAATNADLSFDIGSTTSNTFENFSPSIGEEAINVTLGSTSTASSLTSGRINNNTFTNSGGAIGIDVRGDGALVMEIDNNIANTSRQAIDVITGDAVGDAATADLTITNNTLTVAGTVANPNNEAIGFLGDRNTTNCLNIRGNNGVASGTMDDILLDDFTSAPGDMVLESGPSDCGGACVSAEAHLLANNTISDAFATGIGLVAPGTCNTVP